ncbi:HYR domain-containing protein, partial [Roseivirga sp. E12]|uniref:HYR domain-containing protein n=1 Tax=Roseivirga sp. E12 TaxID=2819237 RepID=UPI001ABCD37F
QTSFDCDDTGVNQVTLTVTDNAGNQTVNTFNVTITDDTAPTVVAQNLTLALDNDGLAAITVEDVDNGSSDNCNLTLSLDRFAFDCSDVGQHTVTLTGTDPSGNTASATATITVVDNIAPTAIAQDLEVFLDQDGVASITTSQIDNGSSDNCGIASITLDRDTFGCGDLGEQTVTLTVTDTNGNSATATATITVTDNIAPIVVTQNVTVTLGENGEASITIPQIDNGSSDNCNLTLSLDKLNFNCDDLGTNTVTLTGIDNSGNTAFATATVTVVDNISPTAVAQDLEVSLDANGVASITVDQINNGSADNCGIANLTISQTTFDCSNIGENTVTLTVTDNAGNTATTTATVVITDTTAPTVITQDITVALDQNGTASITIPQVDNGSSDNCSLTLSLDKLAFDCDDLGTNTVTLTGTDNSGNIDFATATVTVVDNIAPTVTTQNVTLNLDANGGASLTTDAVEVSASSDNCGIVSKVLSQTTFDCSDIGSNSVTYTVTDGAGNSTTQTVTVTIVDNITPTVVAQDISLVLDQNGLASITIPQVDNGSSDNCNLTLSLDKLNFDCSDLGVNTVTLTGVDASGNSATATATVTVIDNAAPMVTVQDAIINIDASGTAQLTTDLIEVSSTDNCGIATKVLSRTSFDCSDLGAHAVTYTVTDVAGNTTTKTINVTVQDVTAPTVVAQDVTIILDENGTASITIPQVDNGSSDNCNLTLSLDKLAFDCDDLGTNTVTLTGTDNSGNTAFATATVTVVDNIAPTAIAQNLEISVDENGQATITADQINNGSTDNCGVASVTISQTDFDCSNIGENTITLTVTDNAGNISTAISTVTIVDNAAPSITSQPATVSLDENGLGSITPSDVVVGVTTQRGVKHYGNSSSHAIWLSKYTPDNQAGKFHFLQDEGSLTQQADGTATVTGTLVNINDENDSWAVQLNLIDKKSWDEWSALGRSWKGSASNVGDNYLDWNFYIMDTNPSNPSTLTGLGNNAGKTKTLAHAPANYNYGFQIGEAANDKDTGLGFSGWFTYQNDQGNTVQGDFNLDITSTIYTVGDGPCATAEVTISTEDFTCNDLGQQTVTITATDNQGNTVTETATVTIVDEIAPTILVQNITVSLDQNGQAVITNSQVDNGSSDNCNITLSLDQTSFDCSNLGTNTVKLTGTDNSGNTAFATATVTVVDNIAPTAITQDLTVYLDEHGAASISANQVNNGSTDNCGVTNVSVDKTNFDCAHLGDNTVTLTVTDISGNTSTAVATITVIDNIAPEIGGIPSNIVYNETDTDCGQAISWTAPYATDNCNVTLASTHSPGDVFPVGTTTVTYTATDDNGNSVNSSFDVTVVALPISITLDANVYNDTEGFNITCNGGSDGIINATVEGGCAPYTYSWSNGTSGASVNNLSAGTYTLTITDGNGTEASKTIELTEPDALSIETNVTPALPGGEAGVVNTIYLGYGDQSVTLGAAASGGNGDYTYEWSSDGDISCIEDNSATVAPKITTNYTVKVTDVNGCTMERTFTIHVVDVRCEGGVVSENPNGGGDDNNGGGDDNNGGGNDNPGGDDDDDHNGGDNDGDDDDDNNNGGNDDVTVCQCEGKMQNFTVTYNGVSGAKIRAYKKNGRSVIKTFYNVKNGDQLTINGFDKKGRLDSKTYLRIGYKYYEIHTSCSESIVGKSYGPFKVDAYTDGEGVVCMSGIGNGDIGNDDDDDKGDDDDDKGDDDDDNDDKKDDDNDDDKDQGDDDDDDKKKGDDDDDNGRLGIAEFDNSLTTFNDNDPQLSTYYGGQSGNINQGCDCNGGMKEITVVYNGTSGTWIKAYNRWGNVILGEYKYVQNGQTLVINGYGNSGLLDSKTYLRVGAYLYKIYTSCYIDIVGKNIGPFTVTGFKDKQDNSCSINDTPDEVEVESTCDVTSYSNNGHALWLSQYSSQGNAKYMFENGFGTLSHLEDGTVTVTGAVYNKHDPNDKWDIQFYLDEGKTWNEWSALGRSYKDEQGIAGSAYQDWTYHILDVSKVSKLIGKGSNAGREKMVSHMPSNYQFGFQIGNKANNKNANYGISGWFYYRNDHGNWVQGDINMDLSNCGDPGTNPGNCDLDLISWNGNITLCYEGQSICVSQEQAADLIANGAKLGSCSVILPSARAPKGVTTESDLPEVATTIRVELSAYPNPTRDISNVTFKSSVSGPASVNIYNTQGHLIGKLFEGDIEADKTYSVEFNGSDIVSGLYMIRVNTAGIVETKKLIIKH